MDKDFSIYIPNPTKHNDGLGDVKMGRMIMVVKNHRRTKWVVRGIGSHGSNGKVWNLDLTPIKEWKGDVQV